MAKTTFKAADVLRDVGGFLYGPQAKARLASALGVPERVVHDTLRGHGGLTAKRLMDLTDQRIQELTTLRDTLRVRIKIKK